MKNYYEEQEYQAYEDRRNIFYQIGINILLIIIILELILVMVGLFSTTFINGEPQIVDIRTRKENQYIEKVKNDIDKLQNIYDKREDLYNTFVRNNTNSIETADDKLVSYGITLEKMYDDLKYLNTPDRFKKFDSRFLVTIETSKKANSALLNYLRSFERQYREQFISYHQRYNGQMKSVTQMWQLLLDKSSTTNTSGFNLN